MEDSKKKATGKRGEDEACKFLIERGHTILRRNWRWGHLEIDIISFDKDGIHFVEVKTRRPPLQGDPTESVNLSKQRRIISAASRFIATQKDRELADCECFFDVVAVVIENGRSNISYYPEAYYPFMNGR